MLLPPNPALCPFPQALAQHGLTPSNESFATAFSNAEKLHDVFKATGTAEDRRRLEEAGKVVRDLHVSAYM